MTNSSNTGLYTLGDRGQTIGGSANDVRGRHVKDRHGDDIGKVADLLVDDVDNKVRFLLVEHGGFLGLGRAKSLMPVDTVTAITADYVLLDQSRERVASAPGYVPTLVSDHGYYSSIYTFYGYAPYWHQGYKYPAAMADVPATPPLD